MTNEITKELRDAIWGRHPTPSEAAAQLRAYAFKMGSKVAPNDNIFTDAATLIELLDDALDAAEAKMGEPVAWMVEGLLRDGTKVLRLPVLTSREDAELYSIRNPDEMLVALYAAPPAAEPVKVKPLVWEKGLLGGWQAETFYGRYFVRKNPWNSNGFEMRDPDCGDSDTLATGEYETEQAALDAAQAYHERNIRSALVSEKETE